ncbi:MAG: phenylalanine--tRNA ligase subunit beta [Candidatus Latescibacteria bacterium]|nr:phenylalanine--tRNA ligase subunit beta [Candidatus Latescibacterota bacterium]
MKITYKWLQEYVDLDWDWSELVDRLTMAGLECEQIDDLVQRYSGFVVGHVLDCQAHPNADALSVCQVDVGAQVNTIVCGAPNVAAGQKVPVVLPGANLPGGQSIGQARIRGVESAGMICSAAELELGDDDGGIMVLPDGAQVGTPLAAQLGLDDVVMEFEVTPNRPDCLSLVGIAREVGALSQQPLRLPNAAAVVAGPPASRDINLEIDDVEGCPRYVGQVIRGITVAPSPAWLQQRLLAVGQRSINNIVDITNYVMLELGQPLHAFDLHRIEEGRIVVRRARAGEELTTLDGAKRALDEEILVIADGAKAVALAGIMGGANSEVHAETRDILLEGAYFSAPRVRLGCNRLGLSTEASMRFQRGTDYDSPPAAVARAAGLIATIAGGEVAKDAIDIYPQPIQAPTVTVRVSRINRLLATDLEGTDCRRILEDLGCRVELGAHRLQVVPPSFRPDLVREVDFVEEVGRIFGYDRIAPSKQNKGPLGAGENDRILPETAARRCLSGLGLDEVVTNTIVEPRWLALMGDEEPLQLANPPAGTQSALRTSLIPSLLDVARRNFNQRASTVAVFELGKCFWPGDQGEGRRLGGLWAGRASASTWQSDQREVDILDLKGVVEVLLEGREPSWTSAVHPALYPGQGARIGLEGRELGFLGRAHSDLCSAFDLDRPVFIFEVDLDLMAAEDDAVTKAFQALAKFPSIERDLSIIVEQQTTAAQVVEQIRQVAPQLIESVDLIAVFQGDQIVAGSKSLTFSIRMRSAEKTMEDKQADQVVAKALRRLQRTLKAELR